MPRWISGRSRIRGQQQRAGSWELFVAQGEKPGVSLAKRQNGRSWNASRVSEGASATAINDRGQVVGGADDANRVSHAFLWENGRMVATSSPTARGRAHAVNCKGQIIGESFTANTPIPFIWQNGNRRDLETLPAVGTLSAIAINMGGEVVGLTDMNNDYSRAFLFRNGKMLDLNRLVNDSRWRLFEASGINDTGQIVGHGHVDGEEIAPSS